LISEQLASPIAYQGLTLLTDWINWCWPSYCYDWCL